MVRYGLIGKTLKHSFSRNYFAEKFAKENCSGVSYENFELPSINELKDLITRNPDIRGFNITIPYKEEILPFLDVQSDAVKAIGACNCVKIDGNKLYGYNTDAYGFKTSLERQMKQQHSNALILGTGGASKAVQYALKELNINYQLVSRNKDFNQLGYQDLGDDILKKYTLIINTTPLGMYPATNDDPPIPYEYLTPGHFLFDLIYNPPKTCFLQKGEAKGAQISNGYEMLVLQAEESWKIWNNPQTP